KAVQKDYERGEIRGKYRLLGVDVQRNYLVWVCRGFDVDGTSWLIDNGTAAVFEDLTALMERYEVSRGIIDTGYRTQEVYEFIHNSRPFWFGAKGWETMPTSYRIAKLDPFTPSTGGSPRRHGKRAITLLHINKKIWQEEMLLKRSGAAQNWWTYSPIDNEYLRQILSVQLVEKVNKTGRLVRQFVTAGHRQDHFWDAETYTLAMSNVFGLGGGVMKGQDLLEEKPRAPQKPTQQAGPSFWDA
uniref:terminase gpA endonuclease subunit n=1 Tax=uncultured Limnobacter sp. TaxID=199681 RepID=UPI0032B2F688